METVGGMHQWRCLAIRATRGQHPSFLPTEYRVVGNRMNGVDSPVLDGIGYFKLTRAAPL
jgi:hypothetical protein